MAFIFVQQFGDGFVQGDRCRVDIDCADGAAAHVTTQASTNVFAARDNFATQLLNLNVGDGAVLEYLPDPIVPFRGSRLYQRTEVTVAPESTAILGDVLLPGRVARDERHAYDFFCSETEARRPDGTLLFADTLRFSPLGGDDPRSIGLLGGQDVVGTLLVLTRRIKPVEFVDLLRAALSDSDVLAGVSELPNACGISLRLLGSTSKTVRAAITSAWNAARLALLGIPALDLRKG
jgi:urease accessory protein